MIVIVCVDDSMGMLFNRRRQSRDRAVVEDILSVSKGNRLYMKEYSYPLFQELDVDHVTVASDFLDKAKEGEYCFVEDTGAADCREKIEQLILYRWNRKYPADLYLDLDLKKGWHLSRSEEFAGTSHEKITKEVYCK